MKRKSLFDLVLIIAPIIGFACGEDAGLSRVEDGNHEIADEIPINDVAQVNDDVAQVKKPAPISALYANSWTTLYRINLEQMNVDAVGEFNCTTEMADLAIAENGDLLGIGHADRQQVLVRIDPRTAACTVLRSIDDNGWLGALATVTRQNKRALISLRIESERGADDTTFVSLGSGAETISEVHRYGLDSNDIWLAGSAVDLLALPDGHLFSVMHGAGEAEGQTPHLVEIDPETGLVRDRGQISGLPNNHFVGGLALWHGSVYLFTAVASIGEIYSLDLNANEARLLTLRRSPASFAFTGAADTELRID